MGGAFRKINGSQLLHWENCIVGPNWMLSITNQTVEGTAKVSNQELCLRKQNKKKKEKSSRKNMTNWIINGIFESATEIHANQCFFSSMIVCLILFMVGDKTFYYGALAYSSVALVLFLVSFLAKYQNNFNRIFSNSSSVRCLTSCSTLRVHMDQKKVASGSSSSSPLSSSRSRWLCGGWQGMYHDCYAYHPASHWWTNPVPFH